MKSRYAALLALSLPSLAYGLLRFSIGVTIPKIESAFSISDSVTGGIVSASVAVVGLGVITSGYAAERYGDRATVLIGLALFSAPLAAMGLSVGLLLFSSMFMLSSFGGGLLIPASYGMVSSILPQRKGIGAGIVTSAYNIGGLIGPAVAGYLLLYYDWNAPLAVIGFTGLAVLAVYVLVFRGTRDTSLTDSRGHLELS